MIKFNYSKTTSNIYNIQYTSNINLYNIKLYIQFYNISTLDTDIIPLFYFPDFNYDAYIIHSSKDAEWVFGILLPILEDRHGFKCVFESRDFVPGNRIIDNIVDAITNSRNVIIVISHNLVESTWGKFSSDLAMSEQVERGRNSVIAIRIDSVDSSKFPSGLKRKDVIDYSSLDVGQKWCKKVIKILEGN